MTRKRLFGVSIFLLAGLTLFSSAHMPQPSTSVSTAPAATSQNQQSLASITTLKSEMLVLIHTFNAHRFYVQTIDQDNLKELKNPQNISFIPDWGLEGEDLIGVERTGVFEKPFHATAKPLYNFHIESHIHLPKVLAPDRIKMAEIRGAGAAYSTRYCAIFKTQNIFLERLGSSVEVQLSKNGGAMMSNCENQEEVYNIWSPDSRSIIYTDYDNNQIVQFFLAKADGSSSQQISHRSNKDPRLFYYDIAWSPNSRYFSLLIENERDILVGDVNNLSNIVTLNEGRPLWWMKTNQLILRGREGYSLYNPADGTHTLLPEIEADSIIARPFGDRTQIVFGAPYNAQKGGRAILFLYDPQAKQKNIIGTIQNPTVYDDYSEIFIVEKTKLEGAPVY